MAISLEIFSRRRRGSAVALLLAAIRIFLLAGGDGRRRKEKGKRLDTCIYIYILYVYAWVRHFFFFKVMHGWLLIIFLPGGLEAWSAGT